MSTLLDAVVAVVRTGRADANVHKINEVPSKPSYPYTVLSLIGDQAINYTLDAVHGARSYRIGAQTFCKTADGAIDYNEAATDRLLDHYLVVAGFECTPIHLKLAGIVREPDAQGVVAITSAFTFNATKEA